MFRQKSDKQKIAQAIGYEFKADRLLIQALTRTSALGEAKQDRSIGNFQRLEFLGDKILGLVIADLLYDCHPTWKEGQLTTKTSELVRNKGPLATIAKKFSLGEFLIMGRGEEIQQTRENDKVLSDAMEALLGALWLDTGRGYIFMRKFIQEHWSPLGLLPPVTYEKLIQLLHDDDISESERIRQLKLYLQQALSKSVLSPFLLDLMEYDRDTPLVEIVLDKGVDQSTLNQALTQYVLHHSPQRAQLLLHHKADPNVRITQRSEYSRLPSTYSALQTVLREFPKSEERRALVKSLLTHRADPNWREQVVRRKVSAKARMRDSMELAAESVLENFADLSPCFTKAGSGESFLDLMRKHAERAKEPLEDHKPLKTALQYACVGGEVEEITALLEAKAKPQLQDAEGDSALHAVMEREESFAGPDHLSIVRALLDKKASPNAQNKKGDTPLHTMIGNHFKWSNTSTSVEVIETLIEAKAEVTLVNKKGNTILHEIMIHMQRGLDICLKTWGPGLSKPKSSSAAPEKEKKKSVAGSSVKTDRGGESVSWLESRLHSDAIISSGTQRRLHEQCFLVITALPAEQMLACMPIKNKEGVAPLGFFNSLKMPADFFQSEPSVTASGKMKTSKK